MVPVAVVAVFFLYCHVLLLSSIPLEASIPDFILRELLADGLLIECLFVRGLGHPEPSVIIRDLVVYRSLGLLAQWKLQSGFGRQQSGSRDSEQLFSKCF